MILADTSAWVEFDRGTGSSVDNRMLDLIKKENQICITEPILMEVTSGARSDTDMVKLRRLLLRFNLVNFDSSIGFDGAAKIYRSCRKNGITPRGLIDCMIAFVALQNNLTLLTIDSDLLGIAKVMTIPLDIACPKK